MKLINKPQIYQKIDEDDSDFIEAFMKKQGISNYIYIDLESMSVF